MGYNYIQSLLVIESLAKLKTRIVQQNIPSEIDKLQRIFFESFPVNILAVYEMSQSSIASSFGVDGGFFKAINGKKNKFWHKRLRGIAFRKFSKVYAVKRDFFLKDLITDEICKRFKFELKKKMLRFCFKLLQCCNFKTLRKNYKGGNARRIWISSKTLKEFRVLELYTLKDRVLQQILSWGIRPISESQADSLSFGFRPQRSAVQAIAYVYNKLLKSKAPWRRVEFKPVKVGKHQFTSFLGKKVAFKRFEDFKTQKRDIKHFYDYWIYIVKSEKLDLFEFYNNNDCLSVDVERCFDEISYKAICFSIPMGNKYLYLVKSWTTKSIMGLEARKSKNDRFEPSEGKLEGPIIKPMVCNILLDGLQDFVQDNLSNSGKKFSREELKCAGYKTRVKSAGLCSYGNSQVFCVRYVCDRAKNE